MEAGTHGPRSSKGEKKLIFMKLKYLAFLLLKRHIQCFLQCFSKYKVWMFQKPMQRDDEVICAEFNPSQPGPGKSANKVFDKVKMIET